MPNLGFEMTASLVDDQVTLSGQYRPLDVTESEFPWVIEGHKWHFPLKDLTERPEVHEALFGRNGVDVERNRPGELAIRRQEALGMVKAGCAGQAATGIVESLVQAGRIRTARALEQAIACFVELHLETVRSQLRRQMASIPAAAEDSDHWLPRSGWWGRRAEGWGRGGLPRNRLAGD
ncbi:MAG TPA: hypothetical protein VIJ94_06040 [Caulobacteraceae bacterium]